MKPKQLTQQVFDRVAGHLLKQGRRSTRLRGFTYDCAYRGDAGLQCAAGVLIDDAHYTPALEGRSINTDGPAKALCASLGVDDLDRDTAELVLHLQSIHDNREPDQWLAELSLLAAVYCLDESILDAFDTTGGAA
jgi:hypothetical protein